MEEKKFCPFRKEENGEFAECYKERCMAYYEYEMDVYPPCQSDRVITKQKYTVCRMMAQMPIIPSYPVAGCAV